MTIESIFQVMSKEFNAEYAGEWEARIQFCFEDEQWGIVISKGVFSANRGSVVEPTLVITVDKNHWIRIHSGALNGMLAMMAGKLKLSGDIGHFKKLQDKKMFQQ